MTNVVVATHGHCFDGLCSAVMFTRLLRHLSGDRPLDFRYHSCGYGPGQNGVDPALLTGDENAILDFRFSASPKLTWYFDHHVSAFPSPSDRAAYEAHVSAHAGPAGAASDRRMFHDGTYTSCTKLIADIGAARFALDQAPFAELVHWADMIDSAAFPSAEMAVARKEPVLRLMTVVENFGDDAFLTKMVARLLESSLVEVASSPDVTTAYEPLGQGHEAFVKLVTERAKETKGVVVVDLADQILEVAGKFVTYALFPKSTYSVLLSRAKTKCKISIGYNPWSPEPRRHNIAAICERWGGGGHPVVGAISLGADKVDEARAILATVVDELGR